MTYFPLPPQPPPSPVCASSEPRTPIALESISDRFNSGSRHFNPELVIGLRDGFDKSDSETLFSLSPEGRTDPNCFSKNTLLRSSNHVAFSTHEIDYTPENTTDSNIAPSTEETRNPIQPSTPNRLVIQELLNSAISPSDDVPDGAAHEDAAPLGSSHSEDETSAQNAKEREASRLEEGWVEVRTLMPNWFSSSIDSEWVKVPRRLPQPEKILVMMVQRAEAKDDYGGVGGGGYCLSA